MTKLLFGGKDAPKILQKVQRVLQTYEAALTSPMAEPQLVGGPTGSRLLMNTEAQQATE